MVQLVIFLLVMLTFGPAGVSCDSCSPATFYIKPSNASNPDCPADCPCVTLDYMAMDKLPNLRNTDSVTLILLEGVHTSTVQLNFVQIKHVIITSRSTADLWTVGETPPTLIRLLSSNISVIDASILEIKNLAVDGSGTSVLLVQKHSDSWTISFGQVIMFGFTLRIQPLSVNAIAAVTVSSSLFKISRIEIKLCVYAKFETNHAIMQNATIQQSTVHIKSTRFLTREIQLNSVVIFSPDFYESQWLLFHMDNVTISALANHVLIPSFLPSYFCDGITKLQHLSDIYIFSDYVKMTIMNSNFLNKGTAIYAKNSLIGIINCTFSGYSHGALVFDGSINLKLFIDSTAIFSNTIRARELVPAAAGLLISSSGQTDLVNCYIYGNTDINGNSQIIELNNANQVTIHNSTFANNNGTVINSKDTTLSLSGVVTFTGNFAHQGGTLYLSPDLKTMMILAEYTTVNFIHNSALQFGGAVYIDSYPSLILDENDENNNMWCFYGPLTDMSSFKHVTLNF